MSQILSYTGLAQATALASPSGPFGWLHTRSSMLPSSLDPT